MIYIKVNEYCIHSEQGEGTYADWSSSNCFEVESAHTTPHVRMDSYAVDAKEGDVVYVLYIRYGSGDSFGHSDGNGTVIDVYTSESMARKAEKIIEKNTSADTWTIPSGVVDDLGKWDMRKVWSPASGYFETFEGVHVTSLVVQK